VGPDVAAAAIGFMGPEQVHREWLGRRADLSAHDAAMAYAGAAADWGRRILDGYPASELAELDQLCTRVIDGAAPSVGALFAAWRALPLPDDHAGAVTVRLNVLRELRGCAHLSAVHAVGLGPLGAIMSTDDPIRGGSSWAATFGWVEPYPPADGGARQRAEELTDTICCAPYSVLTPDEGARFTHLVNEVRAAIEPDGG
ncbi:MAG: hypothetical protein AAGK32_07585, partial [Actinomycetota bacterium]